MPHEIGSASCNSKLHCWSHDIDEPDQPCWRVCLECMHVYRSPEELQREWLENYPEDLEGQWGPPMPRPAKAIPVKDIYFCPLCSHDF